MESIETTLSEDNLLTAARRVVRFIMVDDQSGGGLLSKETLIACNYLSRHVESETKRIKDQAHAQPQSTSE